METGQPRSRRRLLRDLLVFQGKLLLDGLRDLMLSPASLVLGLIDILSSAPERNRFYNLLSLGRRTERWIDLFGAAPPEPDDTADDPAGPAGPANVDEVVNRVEELIRDQYRDGSLSDGARQAIDKGLAGLRRRRQPSADEPPARTDPVDPPD